MHHITFEVSEEQRAMLEAGHSIIVSLPGGREEWHPQNFDIDEVYTHPDGEAELIVTSEDEASLKHMRRLSLQVALVAELETPGWKPDWTNPSQPKYYVYSNTGVSGNTTYHTCITYSSCISPVVMSKECSETVMLMIKSKILKEW